MFKMVLVAEKVRYFYRLIVRIDNQTPPPLPDLGVVVDPEMGQLKYLYTSVFEPVTSGFVTKGCNHSTTVRDIAQINKVAHTYYRYLL